jgi:beta-glucosidase
MNRVNPPTAIADLSIEQRVQSLLDRMTLAEKIGQMTQVEKNSITPEDVTTYAIGSILSGGGGSPATNTPASWAEMVGRFQDAALQTRLQIPLLYGVDAVHGHNNAHGATFFPHNIGLGASGDADLVEQTARITARELVATHVRWNFAPAVSVARDIRWGRTYESFSEDPKLVSKLGAAYVRGLQQVNGGPPFGRPDTVLASVKHFVADGGTTWGTTGRFEWLPPGLWQSDSDRWSIDQGVSEVDEKGLQEVHLAPYLEAMVAGAKNIMVSYNSWGGLKMHAQKYLLTDILKEELGFSGFLVSDWAAISQISADYNVCVTTAINAGLDMVMVPFDYKLFTATLSRVVQQGDVPIERINDAVRRILQVKFEVGLFDHPYGDEGLLAEVGSAAHRAVARQAVRQSLVLLKNEAALPISKTIPTLLVAGQAADDIGIQCGGWSIEWQGKPGAITPGTTLIEGIRHTVAQEATVLYDRNGDFPEVFLGPCKANLAIVAIGELPYAEGEGDRADLTLPAADLALIQRVRPLCDKLVVVLYSGRPLIIHSALDLCDAFVAAWLPGSEGDGVADVLFGDHPFTGKLSFTWPRSMAQLPHANAQTDPLFPFGFGLTY